MNEVINWTKSMVENVYYDWNMKLKVLFDSWNQAEVFIESLYLLIYRTTWRNILNIYLHHRNIILCLELYFSIMFSIMFNITFKVITFT